MDRIKAARPSEKYMLYCPRCGSAGLKWASGLPQLWSIYDCSNCGYRGSLVVKNGELSAKLRKKFRAKRA
jgi:predicted RNA-binding Zn-ribbon protein involved in translation (DUF1610 family)